MRDLLRDEKAELLVPQHLQVLHGVQAAVGHDHGIVDGVLGHQILNRAAHRLHFRGVPGEDLKVHRVSVLVDDEGDRREGQVEAVLFGGASHAQILNLLLRHALEKVLRQVSRHKHPCLVEAVCRKFPVGDGSLDGVKQLIFEINLLIAALGVRERRFEIGVGDVVEDEGGAVLPELAVKSSVHPAKKVVLVVGEEVERLVEVVEFEIRSRVADEQILVAEGEVDGARVEDLQERLEEDRRVHVELRTALGLKHSNLAVELEILHPNAAQGCMPVEKRRNGVFVPVFVILERRRQHLTQSLEFGRGVGRALLLSLGGVLRLEVLQGIRVLFQKLRQVAEVMHDARPVLTVRRSVRLLEQHVLVLAAVTVLDYRDEHGAPSLNVCPILPSLSFDHNP